MKVALRRRIDRVKTEAIDAARTRAQGAGLLAAAGIAGLFAIGFLAAGGALALAIVLPAWAAVLIVGGIFVLLGFVFFLLGRGEMKKPVTLM